MLKIERLHFGYNGTEILSNINMSMDRGNLVVILGPNGVGKTSLLKCINGIHRPMKGIVKVEDKDTLKMSLNDIALHIGYVAQSIEKGKLTVFDAVLMGRKPHLRWRVGNRDLVMVQSVLEQLDLEQYSLRYIDELSGGELQIVAIGRALVQEPQLLLLDEPTSSLDLKNQMHILKVIRDIVDQHHISAVMTMHDLNSALRFADNCCFLKDGSVHTICNQHEVTAETIEEVYGLPVSIHHIDNHPIVIPASPLN